MGSDSTLARFATQSNHLRSTMAHPSPRLFEPNKALKLSVSRIDNKTHDEIVEEGKRVVRERRNTTCLHGWGTLTSAHVRESGLIVDDDDDPPGHSNVVGWPKDDSAVWKYQQRLARLAAQVKLPARIPVE